MVLDILKWVWNNISSGVDREKCLLAIFLMSI